MSKGAGPPTLAAIVAFKSERPPDEAMFFHVLDDLDPTVEPADIERRDGSLGFRAGEALVVLTHLGSRIPPEELEAPCAAAWNWREARDEMDAHRSHVVVTVTWEPGGLIERQLLLTRVVAAAAAAGDAAGIYWGAARLVHSPQTFLEAAREASPDDLPVMLWVGFLPEREPSGRTSLYTRGLRGMGLMDIEIRRSPRPASELAEFAFNVAHYMITRGEPVEHGHTIGGSDSDRYDVLHVPSRFDPETQVMLIVM